MRQLRKDQNSVSSLSDILSQKISSVLLWLSVLAIVLIVPVWCISGKLVDHFSSRCLRALINLFFPSHIPLLPACGAFGKPAWWVVNTLNSNPSIFHFQKAEDTLRLSSLPLPDFRGDKPEDSTHWCHLELICPPRSQGKDGQYDIAYLSGAHFFSFLGVALEQAIETELRLWVCGWAISHVQMGEIILFLARNNGSLRDGEPFFFLPRAIWVFLTSFTGHTALLT